MKFCFFGYVKGAFADNPTGGAELQIFLLTRSLAEKGHEIVIIDPDLNENIITKDGIKLLMVPGWNAGLKGLRVFNKRIPALYKLLDQQNADFYYVRMRSYMHLTSYLIAKKKSAKFILAAASDIDVAKDSEKFKYIYNDYTVFNYLTSSFPSDIVFKYLLKRSDYVMLQHSGQKFISSTNNQVIFPNIIDLKSLPEAAENKEEYFIYAGSLTVVKGADKLLELINMLDQNISIMIVGVPKGSLPNKIYNELKKKKNVTLKGQKNHTETIELISKSKALLNTSHYEGFPNIYLEAWALGVPVISLKVNPGNIFSTYNLGMCCNGDINKMKLCIETNATGNFNKRDAREYVEKFHDFKTAADRFLHVISRQEQNKNSLN